MVDIRTINSGAEEHPRVQDGEGWREAPTRFAAKDGRPLVGAWTLPGRRAPRSAIALHPATGVPARYYRVFARWLAAERDAAVLLYDYRDSGASQPRSLRGVATTMSDWGILDQGGALTHAAETFPEAPLRVLGHSLGGHWLAFHDDIARVDRVTAVASGPIHWRAHPLAKWPAVATLWWLAGPAATAALGYFPGSRLGLGADLPAGVFWQWRRWCLTPGFATADWGRSLPEPRRERARFALHLVAIEDDWMMPPDVVWRLADYYPAARVTRALIEPRRLGLRSVGHLAAFRERNRVAWPLITDALTA